MPPFYLNWLQRQTEHPDAIAHAFQQLTEAPWIILFPSTRSAIRLDFAKNVSYEQMLHWHSLYSKRPLPPVLKEAFELYETIIREQGGVSCDIEVPLTPASCWLLSKGIISSSSKTLVAGIALDETIASSLFEQLKKVKEKVILVEGSYCGALRDFLEAKYGDFNPFVASAERLAFIQRQTGHGRLCNTSARTEATTVFVDAESFEHRQLIAWFSKNAGNASKIVLAGTRSGPLRFRIFESLLREWAGHLCEYKAVSFEPIRLHSSTAKEWLLETKQYTDEIPTIVADEHAIDAYFNSLGNDANVYCIGEAVYFANKTRVIEAVRISMHTKDGRTVVKKVGGSVKVKYDSIALFSEIAFESKKARRWLPLKEIVAQGAKHSAVLAMKDFLTPVPAVVIATSIVTDEQLKYVSTKAEKVFYVGDKEMCAGPPRKRRRFAALDRLLKS